MHKTSYPIDWSEVKTIDVARFFNGRAYALHEWEQQGTPVIRLQNLTGSGDTYYYSNLKLPSNQYCNKGDLLYMWSATFGPHIWQRDKAIYHYHIWKIECSDKIDKKFFFYELARFTEKVLVGASGSTMAHITKEGMEKRILNLPPVKKQKKIGEVLSSVDTCIAQTEETISKLQKIKTGLMQDLFTRGVDANGKLRPSYQEKPELYKPSQLGMIPKEWDVLHLSDLTFKISDRDHTTPIYLQSGVPIISPTNFNEDEELDFANVKYISEEAHRRNFKKTDLRDGDIVFTRIGAQLGKACLVTKDMGEFSILHSSCQIRTNDKLNSKYLVHYLRGWDFQQRMWIGVQSIGVPDLGLSEIGESLIAHPVLADEQKDIANKLDFITLQIKEYKQEKSKFLKIKAGLMQDLLTGKVEVKVDKDE